MPILAVSFLLQLILIVHVIKTGRNTIWVFVLLFAPVVGGLRLPDRRAAAGIHE